MDNHHPEIADEVRTPVPNPPGHLSKMRMLAFTPEDARDFSRALTAALPEVRFVPHNYPERRAVNGNWTDLAYQRPPDLVVPWQPDLVGNAGCSSVEAWRVPEGWMPQWTEAAANSLGTGETKFVLRNKPNLHFVYDESLIGKPDAWDIQEGRVWARYLRDDNEHKAFLAKAWRLIAKLATHDMDSVYDDTGRVYASGKQMVWVGRHALDWCRADPTRRISSNMRPVGSFGAPIPRPHWHARQCENPKDAPNYEWFQNVLAGKFR